MIVAIGVAIQSARRRLVEREREHVHARRERHAARRQRDRRPVRSNRHDRSVGLDVVHGEEDPAERTVAVEIAHARVAGTVARVLVGPEGDEAAGERERHARIPRELAHGAVGVEQLQDGVRPAAVAGDARTVADEERGAVADGEHIAGRVRTERREPTVERRERSGKCR